ncbi:capsule biosynthesis protein [Psittacicella hinzii]|uniref:Capsular polysaccharide transport system permease protein n=1 Tax=Psittacicella hinzii TaxID=2028575 RepID=A0A3A1YN94_9GAMM|nr:capsule biosynthesis protein [Psittacicella hinzii]RIY38699.1 hypothetical protein CKF58_03605 [Psittacicella hinzii]
MANPIKKLLTFTRKNPLFRYIVVLPSLWAIIYFGFIASPVYVSHSTFVVKAANQESSSVDINGLNMLSSVGFNQSNSSSYTVQSYIKSREAVNALAEMIPLKQYYEDHGDWISRYNTLGFSGQNEAFYQYFKSKVAVNIDSSSGIMTLEVRAFQPGSAQKINAEFVKLAEKHVNTLNKRARQDAINYATSIVEQSKAQMTKAAKAMSDHQLKYKIVDVDSQTDTVLNMVTKLQEKLISVNTRLDQLRSTAPNNPQIRSLEIEKQSINNEINEQVNKIAGGDNSLIQNNVEFQSLKLAYNIAYKQLSAAMVNLQNAIYDAGKKQLYLEVIAPADKPDLALEPSRLYHIAGSIALALVIYGLLSLILASVREHRN